MWTALFAALGSAIGFAISSSLQHHAAASVQTFSAGKPLNFLRDLLAKPLWLVGQALATVAFVLHAWALHNGALALVQPIVVSGMVFAVPLRAAMSHRVPSARELRAVALTALGIALFLIASNPTLGDGEQRQVDAAVITASGALVAGACTWLATRVKARQHRALLLGVTAGVLFGLVAGLVKMAIAASSDGGAEGLVTDWSLWTLIVLGAWGVSTNLRAYQIADLSASLPVLSIVNVLVALGFGLAVLAEIPAHSVSALVLEVVAILAVALGLRTLARLTDEADQHASDEHPTASVRP